jgi:hypothetical protein
LRKKQEYIDGITAAGLAVDQFEGILFFDISLKFP